VARTEEDGLDAVLHLTMGGQPVELRVLTIAESDAWLARLAATLSGLDVPEHEDPEANIRSYFTASSEAALGLVEAYDLDHKLGDLRATAHKREVSVALERMIEAEDPFGEKAAHSVAAAFGAPSRFLSAGMDLALAALVPSPPDDSRNGRSDASASLVASLSGAGPASSSSSAGPTRKSASAKRPKGGG
jgi:hypothetical protein